MAGYTIEMTNYATPAEWHAWLRENWPLDENVLQVLMNEFEKETNKICPERMSDTRSKLSPTVTS